MYLFTYLFICLVYCSFPSFCHSFVLYFELTTISDLQKSQPRGQFLFPFPRHEKMYEDSAPERNYWLEGWKLFLSKWGGNNHDMSQKVPGYKTALKKIPVCNLSTMDAGDMLSNDVTKESWRKELRGHQDLFLSKV